MAVYIGEGRDIIAPLAKRVSPPPHCAGKFGQTQQLSFSADFTTEKEVQLQLHVSAF